MVHDHSPVVCRSEVESYTTAIRRYELGGSRSASALAPGLTQGPLEHTQVYVAGQRANEMGGRGTGEK